MADLIRSVGDELLVTHGKTTLRLPLKVPMPALERWLDLPPETPWFDGFKVTRDEIMPAAARDAVAVIEGDDSAFAVKAVREWGRALDERLGKHLSFSPAGTGSGESLPPTSGSVSA